MKRSTLVTTLAIMLAATSNAHAEIPAQIEIDTGSIAGTTGASSNVRLFKGIPYAAPPVAQNRWRPPQAVVSWNGVRDASEFGPRCMQGSFGGPGAGNRPPTDEDCLHLNVWTTAESADDRRPVMVWIYGGGFSSGAGSEPRYNGEGLAKKGAVVVTLNYRLGGFGFLAHPELSAESGRGASGNYGVMDAIAALRWVKRNIEAFGGDPDNVTVFGESAGAIMTAALLGSPETQGLLHRIIAQSGAWMGLGMARMGTLAQSEQRGAEAVASLGAGSIAELRAKPADEILTGIRGGGLVVDGYVFPEDLSETFADGRQHDVDVLAGSNQDEGTFFQFGGSQTADQFSSRARQRFDELSDEFLMLYPANSDAEANESYLASFSDEAAWHQRLLARLQATQGNDAYVYYFTRVPPSPPGRPSRGATHVAEVAYMFDNLTDGLAWTDVDRKLADTMSSYWVNFARTGNPNGPGLPDWPAHDGMGIGKAIVLGDTVHVESRTTPAVTNLEFFDSAYARLIRANAR